MNPCRFIHVCDRNVCSFILYSPGPFKRVSPSLFHTDLFDMCMSVSEVVVCFSGENTEMIVLIYQLFSQALQTGPTELSRYWLYWVPAQYVEAIKDAILGKWQFF